MAGPTQDQNKRDFPDPAVPIKKITIIQTYPCTHEVSELLISISRYISYLSSKTQKVYFLDLIVPPFSRISFISWDSVVLTCFLAVPKSSVIIERWNSILGILSVPFGWDLM